MFGTTRCWRRRGFQLALASSVLVGGAIASSGDCVIAQITPDGTLPNNSIVTSQSDASVIEGGTQAGSNLFHSFEQFSVPTGGAAYFNNALDIQNIFSRVTGGSISSIDGLIQAKGTANLFLLNPNGIIFGPNASLNIGGSFLGSTASGLNFADGTQFSATDPQATPLLTVSVPIGLQYGRTAGGIQVQGSVLQVQTGQTLALVGGDINVEGGEFGYLEALGGRIELGGLTSAGTVDIEGQQSEGAFRLTALRFLDAAERADVLLTNYAYVDVTGGGGGSIAINARNLEVSGGVFGQSGLRARITSGMGSPEATTGDITLNATGAITVAQSSYIENYVDSDATGNAGNIDIKAGNLFIRDGGQIYSGSLSSGNGGNITAIINDLAEVTNSNLLANIELGARGRSGDVSIKTRRLIVRNSQLGTSVFGEGTAGDFKIIASDSVEVSGQLGKGGANSFPGGLFAQVDLTGKGRGGNLTIETRRLSVSDGSKVQVATFGDGDAGNLFIRANEIDVFETEKLNFYSTGLFAGVQIDGRAEAGIINPRSGRAPKGNGGDLTIETRNLSLRNGGQVFVGTTGDGDAGRLFIRARESVNVTGISTSKLERQRHSIITSGASPRSTGNSGSITIETPQLNVADGGIISSSSEGVGKAGDVNIKASFARLNNGQITAETASTDGGNINLKFSQDLLLRNNSIISTNAGTAQAGGNGGNITINAPNGFIVAVPNENTDITANSTNSFGGRVIINAQGIFGTEFRNQQTPESDITASSNLGLEFSGTVEINTPDTDPSQGLATLPSELVDASRLIASNCGAGGKNEFIVTGRGGLPPHPNDPLSSDTVWIDLRSRTQLAETRPSSEEAIQPNNPTTQQLVEAQGWVIDNKGEVVLTATAPTLTPHNPWIPSATCHTSETSS